MVKKLKDIWSVKLTTASLVLIPAAIGINYVAKLFASMLKLPLWLGTLGTCISACLAGPVVGGIAGFLTNVWGDAVFAAMGSKGFFASFVDELVVDIPDKIVVLFLAAGIYKVLPKSLIAIYQSDDEDLDK